MLKSTPFSIFFSQEIKLTKRGGKGALLLITARKISSSSIVESSREKASERERERDDDERERDSVKKPRARDH